MVFVMRKDFFFGWAGISFGLVCIGASGYFIIWTVRHFISLYSFFHGLEWHVILLYGVLGVRFLLDGMWALKARRKEIKIVEKTIKKHTQQCRVKRKSHH